MINRVPPGRSEDDASNTIITRTDVFTGCESRLGRSCDIERPILSRRRTREYDGRANPANSIDEG